MRHILHVFSLTPALYGIDTFSIKSMHEQYVENVATVFFWAIAITITLPMYQVLTS